ncbi:MAG: arginine repressor [Gammaproteobacteria bacterium]|nr:arginine repressor [Gammaproteobacteria bacterium]
MPAETEIREKRQTAIIEILRTRNVGRQTVLVDLLQKQGITATQSSVSRDLKQLGVIKLDSGYSIPDKDASQDKQAFALFSDFIRGIQTAGTNLTVITTAVGAAQRVAVYLDRADWPEIIGTVSGDDTIFVATNGATEQKRLVARLRNRIEN